MHRSLNAILSKTPTKTETNQNDFHNSLIYNNKTHYKRLKMRDVKPYS